jgi:3-dehydroquinate synthetase
MQIPHGIAIGIGMLVAMEFSGNTNETLWNYIMKVLQWSKSDFSNVEFDSAKMIKSLKNDKKNSQTHQKLVLPDKNNKIHIAEFQMTESYLLNQTQITERLIRGIK